MKRLLLFKAILICLLIQTSAKAQINILNITVQPFNLAPEALLNVNIMNNDGEKQAQLITQLFNSNNTSVLTVKSQPFKLLKGLNSANSGSRKVALVEYAGSTQGNYLKSTHNLPSGRYKVCSTLLIENGSDIVDDFCEELEADFNQYLYLVSPLNEDTIDTKNPVLLWTHSEPFSILNQGESYRMVVTEMKKDQAADEAITVNTPAMVKNYLREHELQYPFDARELKDGAKYAWQVQKLSDGVVINKTEAWVFNLRQLNELKSLKYVALKNQLDGSYYNAYNGLVYFKYVEEYKTQGQLKFTLTNNKLEAMEVQLKKDQEKVKGKQAAAESELKITGDNLYELSLNTKKLNSGFYTLEVKNEKNESFYLKIFLP
jgi:hypothetical protein